MANNNGANHDPSKDPAPPADLTDQEKAQRFADMVMTWAIEHRRSCTCSTHPGSPIHVEHLMGQSFAFLVQQHPHEFQVLSTLVKAALDRANVAFLAAQLSTATTPEIASELTKLDPEGKITDLSQFQRNSEES